MKITVGLCSRNRRHLLREVLLSLYRQTLSPNEFEVVLVDDGSTDGTDQMVKSLNPPFHLTYLRQEHTGLAGARNKGLLYSRGKIILYIDDDVLADPALLEEHLKSHTKYDRCVVNGWVNHITTPRIPPRPTPTMADISTSFFWTSNVSVKRKHIIAAGLFDEDFQEYGWEDQELGLRLMSLGLKAKNNYKAIGYHIKTPPRFKDIPRVLNQAMAKARTALLYTRKHPRLRVRLSTGNHPPRLAAAMLQNLGGILEAYCRRRLRIVSLNGESVCEAPPDQILTSHQMWCLRQLATIYYFRTIRNPFNSDNKRVVIGDRSHI